jgi:3-deoxy-7-phosphoheptulonate synthase
MLVTLNAAAPPSTVSAILAAATAAGCESRTFDDGHGGTVVGVAGTVAVAGLPGINTILEKHRPYMLATREGRPHAPTVVKVGGVRIGGGRPVIIGGPCVIASRGGAGDESRRSRHAARGRFQAAHLSLRVPGSR